MSGSRLVTRRVVSLVSLDRFSLLASRFCLWFCFCIACMPVRVRIETIHFILSSPCSDIADQF